eukprot:INCI13908.1.p1 GENE.INCI13908.1~~INCI13908.1.p1  ORF type:complete len:616 (-),score=85.09 INCI13908.1:131-1978(-)
MSDAAMPVESAEAAGDYGTYGENGVAVAGCEGDGGENAAEILAISISSKVNDDAGEGTATDTDTGHRVSLSGKPLLTLDEMSERLGFGCFHVELLFVVSAIWMADAMEMMLISFVSPPLQCYFDLTDAEKAAITSVVFVGMFFGSTSWGYFQDHVGRKIGYYVSVAWVLVFGLGTAFADNYYLVLFLRFMVGFGVAGSHVAVTIFTEFLPANKRALFIVLVNGFWAIGSIIEASLAWIIMPLSTPEDGWRILIGVSCFPLLVVMFTWPVLPESPRFNMIKGRPERIEPVFRRAFRINKKEYPEDFEIDTSINTSDFDDHSAKSGSFKDLFKGQVMTQTTLMLWGIWLVSAFMYYGVIMFTTELFIAEDAGVRCPSYLNDSSIPADSGGGDLLTWSATIAPQSSNVTTMNGTKSCVELTESDYRDAFIQSVAELPAMIWTFFILEKWGRKPAMGLQMFLAGGIFLILNACTSRTWETFFLFLVRGLISGAFQSAFVYTPEVYPTNIRATGIGLTSSAARIGGLATPYVAQVLMGVSLYGTVCLYAAMAVAAGILAFFLPIETRGRALEDLVDENAAPNDVSKLAHRGGVEKSSKYHSVRQDANRGIALSEVSEAGK